MKYLVSVFIFFLTVNLSVAQVLQKYEQKIEWTNKTEIHTENETFGKKFYLLNFEGVTRLDQTNLPYFAKTIRLAGNYGTSAELQNLKFEPMKADEKSGVRHLNNIATEILVNQTIGFERKTPLLKINFIPLRKNPQTGQIEKLVSFTLVINKNGSSLKNKSENHAFAENSVMSSGKWVKIGIPETGVYKITNQQLTDLGFSNPFTVRVFGNDAGMLPFENADQFDDDLIENKIFRGPDYILFYAKSAMVWNYDENNEMFLHTNHLYADTAHYFLTDKNTEFNNDILTISQSSQSNNLTVSQYDYYTVHENDEINLLNSGQIWLGESFENTTSQDFAFNFPNLVSGSEMKLCVNMVARSPVSSTFTCQVAGTNLNSTNTILKATGDTHGRYALDEIVYLNHNAPSSENFNLNISYSRPTPSSKAWLNYIVYNGKCQLKLQNGQTSFRNAQTAGAGNVTQFNLSSANSSTIVWDVTNPTSPQKINATTSGTTFSFKTETDEIKEFVAFDGTNFLTPVLEGRNIGEAENQNLHAISANTEMIIVTHPDFIISANEIAEIHRTNDNMNVEVATTDQVFNEYSSGTPDATAIRNFMRNIYWKPNSKLKYLLLMGDGSYKNKGQYPPQNSNFIPTFQSKISFYPDGNNQLTTVSDDYFVMLDNAEGSLGYHDELDLGVGRMPVNTSDEAAAMVAKIRSYINPANMGDWQNTMCFVGDDEDGNGHMYDAERLSTKLDTTYKSFVFKKIYLDAYPQETSAVGDEYPQAVVELNNRINQGALIVNYSGHGSTKTLAHERLVTISDINSWNNFERLSLFFTGTCEFSRFDNYSQQEGKHDRSAGEYVFLNDNGGAISMFTTARVSYSYSNFNLNKNAYDYMFEGDENGRYRFGDIYRMAKNDTQGANRRYFALFGDPALALNYAEHEVITTSINGIEVKAVDTISALERVSVTGEIRTRTGNKMTDFNGVVYPTVLDKNKKFFTLGNEEEGPFEYNYQNNVLFKGRATVRNGEFSFSFIVPRDIYYNYGYGKISYFAKNETEDARGYFTDFIIGGTSDNISQDNEGPQIQLFMNDSTFINGGLTNQNPLIFAKLADESGINTAGSGIGHDITATIDQKTSQMFVLNDYYEAELDSYQKGKVEYGLFKLEDGEHTLKLKAWDVYNNSSEKEINFLVAEATEFEISRLFNYPNPFTTNTSFFFEHNQAGTELDVLLQIFTVSGKVVKTIHTQMQTTGYMSEPLQWDGNDDFGAKIGRGVYIYRLKITTPNGKNAEKFEKLLIIK